MLEDALRFAFEKLTQEQLVDLAIVLTVEGIHSSGRKPAHYKSYVRKDFRTVNELIFGTRQEAETIFALIREIFDKYSQISTMDVIELCGYEPKFTDAKTGWKTLEGMHIRREPEGWTIVMPGPSQELNA